MLRTFITSGPGPFFVFTDMEEPVSSNTSESKVKKKKSRKRVKAIHTKIKEQVKRGYLLFFR